MSARTEYACKAMLELAVQYGSQRPVRIRSIADAHGIPPRFLVQILLQLKGAGLVASTRGASGGYRLARDPSQITLAEVVAALEGDGSAKPGGTGEPTPAAEVLGEVWRQIAEAQQRILQNITLADLLERIRGRVEQMYYI